MSGAPELLQETGQPAACLEGLWADARALAAAHGAELHAIPDVVAWLRTRPHIEDTGQDPGRRVEGCTPPQRSRWLPSDGLNCWERAVHFLAWQIARSADLNKWQIADRYILNNVRHILIIDTNTGRDLSWDLMPDTATVPGGRSGEALRRALANAGPLFDANALNNRVGQGASLGASVGGQTGAWVGAAVGGAAGALEQALRGFGVSSGADGTDLSRPVGVSIGISPGPGWLPLAAMLIGGVLLFGGRKSS